MPFTSLKSAFLQIKCNDGVNYCLENHFPPGHVTSESQGTEQMGIYYIGC